MKERILAPLDGSKIGEAALPYVKKLVSKLSPQIKVEITLFQVLSPTIHPVVGGAEYVDIVYTEGEMAQLKKKAMDYLEETAQSLGGKRVVVEVKVGVGNVADEIIRTADEMNVDLIVMSTHGRSGISRWAFGSVTDRVLRGGNAPVLVMKAVGQTEKT